MNFEQIVILGNNNDWLDKSLTDFKAKNNCTFINTFLPCKNKRLLRIASIHYSDRANKIIKLPFKSIWFRYFCKSICSDKNANLLLIIYDWNKLGCNKRFLKYVRKHFPNISMVYVFTNIIQITSATKNNFVSQLKNYYDEVYTFEENDAKENGFKHTQLVYSKNDVKVVDRKNECFFAGKAKDRLSLLLKFYYRFRELGLSCNYHIIDVDETSIIPLDGVVYNKRINYSQVIQETSEALCVIEVPQKNSTEWTIKLCEAIYYNKIFITTNKRILDAPFYDDRYMFCVEDPLELTERVFDYADHIEYKKEALDYFSVDRFLKMIINDLNEKRGDKNE